MAENEQRSGEEALLVPKGYRQFMTDADAREASEAGRAIRDLIEADAQRTRFQGLLSSPLGVAGAVVLAAVAGGLVVWAVLDARQDHVDTDRIVLPDAASPQPLVPDPLLPDMLPTDAAAMPSAGPSTEPAQPPEHAVLPPQGEPVLAAPPAVPEAPPPTVRKGKGQTLIYEAPADSEDRSNGSEPDGGAKPVIIGARSRDAGKTARPPRMASLTAGTTLPAVLESPIDTARPGTVRAVVSSEVRSHDGARVLVPRLSRLEGQYRGVDVRGGKRAMVVWTRIVRPDGSGQKLASANAASSAFADQFGSAPVVSLIGGGAGGDMRVRPGEPIRVNAARDVALDAAP